MPGLDEAPEGAEELTDNLEDLAGAEGAGDGASDGQEGDTPTEGEGVEAPEGGAGEGQAEGVAAADAPVAEDEDEFEITFGDEAAPVRGENSDLVKHLRAEVRKRDDELQTLRKAQPAPAPADPGPKPTLESCDFDGEKFETELDAWKDRRRAAEAVVTQSQQTLQAEQERFQQRLQVYAAGKDALKVKDFDVAEALVTTALSPVQQAIALKAASDPAKLLYALGCHPQKLAELKAIQDPIELAVAITKLEGQLKVTQRTRTPPAPDRPVQGAAPLTGARVDKVLEKLEADAARTGDRTAVVRYNREQRAKAAARK